MAISCYSMLRSKKPVFSGQGWGLARKDTLFKGGGSGQRGQSRTRGGGGPKIMILGGRPLWMVPYLLGKELFRD